MKLGINGWRVHGQRTGVGRFLLNTVRHWTPELLSGRFAEITFYSPKPIDRRDIPLPDGIRERVLRPSLPMLLWENALLGPVARDDVVFHPSFSRPLLVRGKTVVAVYEADQKLYPTLYPWTARYSYTPLYGWSARHATLVISASEAARQDIARAYGVPHSRIRPVPLAAAKIFTPRPGDPRVDEVRQRYHCASAPFFLFVGKLTGRRNVPKLLQAFAELKGRKRLPHKLLVIGLNTRKLDLETLAARFGVSDQVLHWSYVPDDDLSLLYNAAESFIMPFVYEAGSLTMLEAQASGTPLICTDTPFSREATAGTACLMPTAEVPDIVEAMNRVATEARFRRELSEGGLANARRYSWERTAAETLAVLEEAAYARAPGTSEATPS